MGDIKDIIDLITQLSKRIKDRETIALLLQVQSLVAQLQSDIFQLQKENLELKKKYDECTQKINKQSQGEICRFCKEPALMLITIEDDKEFGHHLKWGNYKCSKCHRTDKREIKS